jgi:hypothetical protein
MGTSSNAVSKSDFEGLQSTVRTLQTKIKSLESTSVDDKAIQGIVKNIDYIKLKNELSMSDLSTEVLKTPGAIADSVAQSFTKDSTKMTPIATALADNQTFATTMAKTLTDSTSQYKSSLRGEKGETGNLTTSKEAAKDALYDKTKYTMWCADGDICKLPATVKGIDWGYGGSKIIDDAQLRIMSDDQVWLQVPGEQVVVQNGWGGLSIRNPDDGRGHQGHWTHFGHKHGDYRNYIRGRTHVDGGLVVDGRDFHKLWDDFYWTLDNNMVRRDKTYEFRDQNQQGRHCIDAGSNGRGCNWDNTWQRFSIVPTPHGRND